MKWNWLFNLYIFWISYLVVYKQLINVYTKYVVVLLLSDTDQLVFEMDAFNEVDNRESVFLF